jgi:hypothetical protein
MRYGKGVLAEIKLNARTRMNLSAVVFIHPSQILYLYVYQTHQTSGIQYRNKFNISQITRLLVLVP